MTTLSTLITKQRKINSINSYPGFQFIFELYLFMPSSCISLKFHRSVARSLSTYTQGNIFEILLNQPKIRLYLPFSD